MTIKHSLLSWPIYLLISSLIGFSTASQAIEIHKSERLKQIQSKNMAGQALPYSPIYNYTLSNNEVTTQVSGNVGSKQRLKTQHKSIVKDIIWWESWDRPVRIRTSNAPITAPMTLHTTSPLYPKAIEIDVTSIPVEAPGIGKKSIRSPADAFIYKLQVCTNDKRNSAKSRLKGIRAWVRTMDNNNPTLFTNQPTPIQQIRRNCKKWHQVVSCGERAVASGLEVHSSPFHKNRSITGIALICQKVIKVPGR